MNAKATIVVVRYYGNLGHVMLCALHLQGEVHHRVRDCGTHTQATGQELHELVREELVS